jgi:hypothetical protein
VGHAELADALGQGVGDGAQLRQPNRGVVEDRHAQLGQRELAAEARHLLGLEPLAMEAELPGGLDLGQAPGRQLDPGGGGRARSTSPSSGSSKALITTGPSWTPALSSTR